MRNKGSRLSATSSLCEGPDVGKVSSLCPCTLSPPQSSYSTVDMTSLAKKIVEFARTVDGPGSGRRRQGPQYTLRHYADVLMGKCGQ